MKNTHVYSAMVALAVLNILFTPGTRAESQTRDEITALLTSGAWHFKGKDWANDRKFARNGAVYMEWDSAHWKIAGGEILITFASHEDKLFLPLDARGTKGLDSNGNDMVATVLPGTDSQTPATSGLTLMTGSQQDAITAMLVAKRWHFTGAGWSNYRLFKRNGTLENLKDDRPGPIHWKIAGNQIILTYPEHTDILFLPLDPKGTKGLDAVGLPILAIQEDEAAAPPAPAPATSAPGGGNSSFGTTNAPVATPPPAP